MLDAEGVGAQNRCGGLAKYTVSRRHLLLEVLQTNLEISPAAGRAAAEPVCQQTFRVLKMMQLYLEHTRSENLKGSKE